MKNTGNDQKSDELLAIARTLGASSEETTRTVLDIKNVSDQLSAITHQQYSLVKGIFEEAEEINTVFNRSNNHANQSIKSLHDTVGRIEEAFTQIEGSMGLFDDISKCTESIYRVVQQTKILAINAAVEAARVGEAGRGFSIVASEMQELAKVCDQASKDIDIVVDSTREQIGGVVQVTKDHVLEGRTSTADASQALIELLHVFEGDTENEEEDKTPSVKSILDSVRNMDKLANDVTHMADNTTHATQKLNNEVESSNQVISDLIGAITDNPIINIGSNEAFENLGQFRIVDVRRPDEFNDELGHISGAKLLPIHEKTFKQNLSGLDKSRTYLFVCRSGGRSARGARIAQSLGFTEIFNLEGGMLAWNKCQLAVTR